MKPNGNKHWETARVENRTMATLPAYGYLHGFHVKLLAPVPNMDTAHRYIAFIDVRAPDGTSIPFEVIAEFESVE